MPVGTWRAQAGNGPDTMVGILAGCPSCSTGLPPQPHQGAEADLGAKKSRLELLRGVEAWRATHVKLAKGLVWKAVAETEADIQVGKACSAQRYGLDIIIGTGWSCKRISHSLSRRSIRLLRGVSCRSIGHSSPSILDAAPGGGAGPGDHVPRVGRAGARRRQGRMRPKGRT